MYTMRFPLFWVVMAAAIGCGGSLPPRASPDDARSALVRALDTWQKAESIQALAQGQPAVYFNDPRCTPDVKLVTYKMLDAHEFYGQSVRIEVEMTFQLKDGTTKERKVSYVIDTSPAIVIVPG
jgi:hypothetical protein